MNSGHQLCGLKNPISPVPCSISPWSSSSGALCSRRPVESTQKPVRGGRPTYSARAVVPVTSFEVYQYTTSVAPKKIPQPRNSQPSTFIWDPLLCFGERSHWRSLARALDGRDRLLDPVRFPAPLDVRVVRLEGGPLGP